MKEKISPMIIFIAVVIVLLISTHGNELNQIPGVEVDGGGITVDIGDFHYKSEVQE